MVMKITPHPAETKEGHQAVELNGKTLTEDKYGVVSSSTEKARLSSKSLQMCLQIKLRQEEGEAKQERLLRRRAPRNPPANLEASQSAMVSSTSSSPECIAATAKRVSPFSAACTIMYFKVSIWSPQKLHPRKWCFSIFNSLQYMGQLGQTVIYSVPTVPQILRDVNSSIDTILIVSLFYVSLQKAVEIEDIQLNLLKLLYQRALFQLHPSPAL
ncbi:hypothetical protein OS493_030706 [Desmophyllum pertusum]|uniref:Uncharacterized protein n=1 Tax=Desmophyllum pertusum TaxID=174260 RepID=A0A9X0CVI1_9CNID|nr:hypothetical protein OS493_030706 [Desmophyllum pertusum]